MIHHVSFRLNESKEAYSSLGPQPKPLLARDWLPIGFLTVPYRLPFSMVPFVCSCRSLACSLLFTHLALHAAACPGLQAILSLVTMQLPLCHSDIVAVGRV